MSRPARRAATLVAALAFAILWMVVPSVGTAYAHAGIVKASPEYDETVSESPEQVRIRFNEPVEAIFRPLEVYNRQGERVDLDDARTDPNDPAVLMAGLEPDLPAGIYTVRWRATSADGHPIDGRYRFTVKGTGGDGGSQQASARGTGEQEQAASREEPARQEGSGGEPRSASSVWLYSGLGLGALAVVALAGLALQRRGKPR